MAIPESQLETWSHQGAVATAKATADSIKNALDSYNNWPAGIEREVYLQGSYKNDTNIRGDSDVDIVVQLNSTFCSDLSKDQQRLLEITSASYFWSNFKADILRALNNYYGQGVVTEGNKSLKVEVDNGRLPADVVVSLQYRKYRTVSYYDYIEGVCFWPQNGNGQIINYPKSHYDNGVLKHQGSNRWYKPTVRIFKNARGYLVGLGKITEDSAPSYFVESMVYNVPDNLFGQNYALTIQNAINFLWKHPFDKFICPNHQHLLFGNGSIHWNSDNMTKFLKELIDVWNNR